MGTPIQFGDVVRALEICLWIKRNCFESINNASILYLGLKQDVTDLEKRLEQFQASFERAVSQIAGDHNQAKQLKLEADHLVGDFGATLDDCKKLLKKHAEFENGRATVLHNAFWHTNTQPLVTELRSRLQSHHYKIYLFIEPFKFDLLSGIQADTNEILAILRREAGLMNPVQLPQIPRSVCSAFERALQRDAPERIDHPGEIPLQDGVDALSRHYRDCTFQSDSLGIEPSQQSNLSLLKAHWLYQTIENSEAFKDSRPGSLFRRIVEQLGQGVEKQYQKRKIRSWPENAFSDLDDLVFAIWPVKVVPKAPVLTDPANREATLAREPLICPYPGEKQELFIFKVNENLLRMVESRSRVDNSIGVQMTERFIHLNEDRFIPLYAIASSDENKGSVNLTHGKGAALASYEFKSRRSVLRVQQAFTGYRSIHETTSVWCSLTHKIRLGRHGHESGLGEVQMWEQPGSLDVTSTPSSPRTMSSSERSMATGSSYTLASQTFSGFDSRVMSIIDNEDGNELVLAQLPEPPQLVVLLRGKKHFSIWQLDLSCLEVGNSRTVRHGAEQPMYRTTLQVPNVKQFPVKRLNATREQLDMWDLHALQFPSSSKTKSKDRSLPAVEKLEATGLDLDFATEQARDRFEKHFKAVSNARTQQVNHFIAGGKVASSQAFKPTRRSSYATTNGTRRDSVASGSESTIRGIPPVLNEIPRFSVLSLNSDVDSILPVKKIDGGSPMRGTNIEHKDMRQMNAASNARANLTAA